MGPKKGKDVADENYWRTSIEEAPLDDDTWKVKVILIEAAGSDQDRIYLNKFEIFAAEEKRFVIKNICKTETIFMVNQLGGEKKIKDDNLKVFEEGQSYLKDKKDIPPDILALIIKHLILKMKDEYLFIKRQRLEVKEGMRRESSTMIDKTEVRGTISVKLPEPPLQAKGKGKKGEPEPVSPEPAEGKKYNTLLRVRGEEWRDKVYVDDYPTDGPNLYVAVTGFVEPYLPGCLVKIGILLTAIIQIRIDPTLVKVPSSLFRATKRGQSQTELLTEKSMIFWENLQQLRINKKYADDFKKTAFIVFAPPYWDTERLSGSADKIYDDVCFLMYDIQDLTRQHIHYLEHMDVINVPMEKEEERCKKYYQQYIKDLPLESVTIYSVLDSILQAVSRCQEIDEKRSRSSLSTAITLNRISRSDDNKTERAQNLVRGVFNTLCKTEKNKKHYRVTYGEEYECHRDPIIINYGDFVKDTTYHLGNINLDNIVWSTLFRMPINKLWQNQDRPQGELEAKINFHVNVLLSCFDRKDVETAELNRLIHILSCRKLYNNRSSLKSRHIPSSTICDFKKVYLKRSVLATPLRKLSSTIVSSSTTSPSFPSMTRNENVSNLSYTSDPETQHIKFLFDCPDLSELVSATEIANNKPNNHMIDNFEFFEDFFGTMAFQILLETFNKYNCVDYKYCEVTDCIAMMFFNSHDKEGIARDEWRCHLTTPLCLQDFFDFVLEEHFDWIQNEERIYDEHMVLKSQSIYKDLIDPLAAKSCVDNTQVEMELIMEGSLKYQEISQIEESTPETTETKYTSSKKTSISPTSTEADSKSSKKAKSLAASTPKHLRQSFLSTQIDSSTSITVPKKPFSGYDLGDRRVEVVGRDSTFFSKDGTRVVSHYSLIIPMNAEYINLSVIPGNGNNEFWFHRALGEYVAAKTLEICESFRITSKDRVMININKQSYQVALPSVTMSSTANPKPKECSLKFSSGKLNTIQQIYETRSYHSLFITWPNGLITESVYENNSPIISHIKQYHVKSLSHLDEDMRCISLNGEVVIFRLSGDIEVLRPDSTYIKITNCEKSIIMTEVVDDIHSETSSDKSKKSKDKGKEKSSKASSKSSKNALSDDDKVSDVKLSEYELIIKEFEYIYANGLRQKWVNDVPVDIEKLLIRTATDYCLREIFSRRMDGTNILLNKDGVQVVTFPNNTKIITSYYIEDEEIFPEWTDEEKEYFDLFESDTVETETIKSKISVSQKSYIGNYSSSIVSSVSRKIEDKDGKENARSDGYVSVQIIFTIEHPNFTTVTINKSNNKVSIDSPNDTRVEVDINNHYYISLDKVTFAKFDGELLIVNYEACPSCQSSTVCKIKVKSDDKSSVTKIHQNWLKIVDSFCKKAIVNEEGSINIIDEPCSKGILHSEDAGTNEEYVDKSENVDDKSTDCKSESSVTSHGKCREMYIPKTIKFFVLRRDLGCSELVHRALLEEYKQSCRWQPWCSVNHYDTFGDHRSVLTILKPIHLTETEKWLMDSKLANKPKYLTYKDLKKDSGKGFYHWMRPYERFESQPLKPDNVLPPRLPRAFVLRTLEQQWSEEDRDNLKGASELLNAVLRYRQIMESDSERILNIPILDPRPEDERRIDDIIQALAHKIYEDLKVRLEKDVQGRAKPDITTKPPIVSEEMSVEGEQEKETTALQRILEDGRKILLREVEAVEKMSPNLKKYWRRRNEEYKEEQFYQHLLREGSVPPYFRNVLGGAIWWEINSATNEAVNEAERRKMKCVCPTEDTSKTDDLEGLHPFTS